MKSSPQKRKAAGRKPAKAAAQRRRQRFKFRLPAWRAPLGFLAVALLGGFLVGCSSDQGKRGVVLSDGEPLGPQQVGDYKVGKPYQVAGVWYYPKSDYGYDETGIGSWYGPGFHGRKTANGETYDQFALTAAHPTLPLPTIVQVTNLDNGRAIKVRINDRGPFKNGRIIDLSRRGAELLGYIGPGTAKVRVQVMEDESRQQAALALGKAAASDAPPAVPVESVSAAPLEPLPGTSASAPQSSAQTTGRSSTSVTAAPVGARTDAEAGANRSAPIVEMPEEKVVATPVRRNAIYIQAGAFQRRDYATQLSSRLSSYGRSQVTTAMVGTSQFYRVRLGPLPTVTEADRLLQTLIGKGHKDARVVVD